MGSITDKMGKKLLQKQTFSFIVTLTAVSFFWQNISCEEGQHLGAHVKLRPFVIFNFGTSGADLSKIKSINVG